MCICVFADTDTNTLTDADTDIDTDTLVGLFGGNLGLFCGNIGPQNSAKEPHISRIMQTQIQTQLSGLWGGYD